MYHRSDPTANQAIGAVSREWNKMERLAEQIRKNPYSDWSLLQSRKFNGIFKRLLTDATDFRRNWSS
ncbi:MAG: hypothetical protein IJ074_04115 [Clostridia bacterium]|nr:hypothetical protein [Clostridia bacterium]